MTELLEQAVEALKRLPAVEQDDYAIRILVESGNLELGESLVQDTPQVEITGRSDWP